MKGIIFKKLLNFCYLLPLINIYLLSFINILSFFFQYILRITALINMIKLYTYDLIKLFDNRYRH